MNRNVIVFGGGGQLGVELCAEFGRRGWKVQRIDRRNVDITDFTAVEQAVKQAEPEVVVNSAAYNQVDIAEREPLAAYQVNALAVRHLAVASRQLGCRLVHYSTDYVFDGTKDTPYVESDAPHPMGAYGISKLAGEFYARAYLSEPLIIRTSGVFGPGGMFTPRGNFVELMLRLAAGAAPVRVLEDHVASPTYAPALAARTVDLVEKGLSGTFHIGGGEAISWYEYARLIFELGRVPVNLEPTNGEQFKTAARRPKFSALSNSKLAAAGIAPMPSIRQAVSDYFERRAHTTAHRSE